MPLGVTRTYVKQVEVGAYPQVRRHFQVTRCNQCDEPPCVDACPVTAMFQRPDGIVDFDRDVCIGCKACIAACPYDAIYINPENHSAEKCNFCAHRVDQGLTPACVAVCPTQAIIVGDLRDPESAVSRIIARDKVDVRRPEKGTQPKLFYKLGSEFTLRPLAAGGGSLQAAVDWGGANRHRVHPRGPASLAESAAAAIIAYDNVHRAPWDWKVSLYTWTKSISAGVFLVFALLWWLAGPLPAPWPVLATGVSGAFLAATGGLLIAHLSHPRRFWYILARPQWRSWLARGAFIMTGYGAVLALCFVGAAAGWEGLLTLFLPLAAVLALLTAVFTAFLLGQSKGRDLWQNPLLPLEFVAHALLAGSAAVLLLSPLAGPVPYAAVWIFAGSAGATLLTVLSEAWTAHPTADGARAVGDLVRGRYARHYWSGLALAGMMPLLAAGSGVLLSPAGLAALVGLLLCEHAYVQAGQSVPLS